MLTPLSDLVLAPKHEQTDSDFRSRAELLIRFVLHWRSVLS